jgi:hypothetical protein
MTSSPTLEANASISQQDPTQCKRNITVHMMPYPSPVVSELLAVLNLTPSLSLPRLLLLPKSYCPHLSSNNLKALNALYLKFGKLISTQSHYFFLVVLLQIRRRLHWSALLSFLHAYNLWWKRVLLKPRSRLEKMVNRNSIWLLIAALRGVVFARPQPVPISAPQTVPAKSACSPLELVIGMPIDHGIFDIHSTN